MIGPELLAEWVRSYGPALVLYARQWCRSPDDVVQEAFVQLMAQRAPPEHPRAWLYHVVRNRAINAARSERRRQRHEEASATPRESWFQQTNEQAIAAREATAALARLPLDQREVIVARLWGGLSLEEVAQLAGTSVSTAFRRYQAGLQALRERLDVKCLDP